MTSDIVSDSPAIIMRPLRLISPAPENDKIYRPIRQDDPAFIELVRSVRANGVLQPLLVCQDGFILSGHRRHAAATAAGLREVPVIVDEAASYYGDLEGFVRLLAEHNTQRVKSLDEQIREAVVKADPESSYRALIAHRDAKSDLTDFEGDALAMGDFKARKRISGAKKPMLDSVARVLAERRKFWPLSDRAIHYAMLNLRPLKHASKPKSTYQNDRASYQDLTNLLTRARLAGIVPWKAIADETRPFVKWQAYSDAGQFLADQVKNFATGYYRDLMVSQPNHIEIVGEKLTVQSTIRPIAGRYRIPMMIGRGYCSIQPRYEMAARFRRSGKDHLIVLILSDFDPDGEQIAQSFARSMRDDFGIASVLPIKVAIGAEHVARYNLPPLMEAKASSANHAKFVGQHGKHAYELEALPPETLQLLLTEAIDSVIDVDAFNREIDAEKADAAQIHAHRSVLMKALATPTQENP